MNLHPHPLLHLEHMELICNMYCGNLWRSLPNNVAKTSAGLVSGLGPKKKKKCISWTLGSREELAKGGQEYTFYQHVFLWCLFFHRLPQGASLQDSRLESTSWLLTVLPVVSPLLAIPTAGNACQEVGSAIHMCMCLLVFYKYHYTFWNIGPDSLRNRVPG